MQKVQVVADRPLHGITITVEGLEGRLHQVAQDAAQNALKTSRLRELFDGLKADSQHAGKVPAIIQINLGPQEPQTGSSKTEVVIKPHGFLYVGGGVTTTPESGGSAEAIVVAKVMPEIKSKGLKPLRFTALGSANLGRRGLLGRFLVTPIQGPIARSPVVPSLELGTGIFGLGLSGALGLAAPMRANHQVGLLFQDRLLRHSVRIGGQVGDHTGSYVPGLEASLPSFKSFLSYHYTSEIGHSDALRPRKAGCVKNASAEVAGLGGLGDVSMLKGEVSISRWGLGPFAGTWRLCGGFGMALPFTRSSTTSVTPWEERQFLGGAFGLGAGEGLAGFAPRGVASAHNPESKFDDYGGQLRAGGEASYRWPLPVPELPIGNMGLKLHGFMFGGMGLLLEQARPKSTQDLFGRIRASAGAGVGFPLPGGGFVGVVATAPLRAWPEDSRSRIQLYLSLSSTG